MRAAMVLAAGVAMLPDADVLGFYLGAGRGTLLWHRGFTHSLAFAGLVAVLSAALFPVRRAADRWRVAAAMFAATASHGLLDALTDGGSGIAFFAPFDETRYFFPFTPIPVAPIRVSSMFTRRGISVLAHEALLVWAPAGLIAAASAALRCRRQRSVSVFSESA